MRILVTGYNYRNIANFLPVLQRLEEEGASIHLMLFPCQCDMDSVRLKELPYPRIVERPIHNLQIEHMSKEELLEHVGYAMRTVQPDLILLDDIFNYPSHCIYESLTKLGLRPNPPIIAFQHGLEQDWPYYNRTFPCDYFFCFGPSHQRHFDKDKHDRVIPTGLPKMDRLKTIPHSDQDYMLFIGQWAPNWHEVKEGFRDLVRRTGMPMVIRPHPQFHFLYKGAENEKNITVVEPFGDILPLVANCSFVITPGSTSGLEALWFGKKVVVLKAGSAYKAYDPDLFLSEDYSADAILKVLARAESRHADIERFLYENTGGRDADSVENCLKKIREIVT